jgi:hypothetical protein
MFDSKNKEIIKEKSPDENKENQMQNPSFNGFD